MAEGSHDAIVRRFGVFEINLQSCELRKNGMRIRLSGQPFQVLAVLVERAGHVVTREELHSKLWQAETFVDFDHGLNNAVARIREVLDDSSSTPRYVETVPRRGYRFIAPFASVQPATDLQPAEPDTAAWTEAGEAKAASPSKLITPKRFAATRRTVLVVSAVATAALATAFGLHYSRVASTGWRGIRSVAVLPLKNFSGDVNQEYLADGMTDELIGRLAGIHD